mmetsp:Transcript_25339/g.42457  ORF Transcript_25339/g.42457 Transcript_25339/m.42457 type:complete len:201 (-) Transcript_25339:1157-1759(-)
MPCDICRPLFADFIPGCTRFSAYVSKHLESSSALRSGSHGGFILRVASAPQSKPLNHSWFMMSFQPSFRQPSRWATFTCKTFVTRSVSSSLKYSGQVYSPLQILVNVTMSSSRRENGVHRVTSSYTTMPHAHTSALRPCPRRVMISGAMYSVVPHTVYVFSPSALSTFPNPKSEILTYPSASMSRFSSLRSRYTMPFLCR